MKVLENDKGQALVEFTLILPLILLILMGILEFGIMLNTYLTINHATQEGARLGALGGTDAAIITQIKDRSPTLDATKITVIITPTQALRTSGTALTITVDYQYQVVLPVISSLLKNGVKLTAQKSMRME